MLLAVGEHVLGPIEPQVIRMSSALAGGVGRSRQEMCGALPAGVLIIGALYGRANLEEDDGVALALAERYRADWLAEFGHTQCEPLLERCRGPDRSGSCAPMVERVAQILLEILDQAHAMT